MASVRELADEFERRAAAAEASRPTGAFLLMAERYHEHRSIEARVWREAAALAREHQM